MQVKTVCCTQCFRNVQAFCMLNEVNPRACFMQLTLKRNRFIRCCFHIMDPFFQSLTTNMDTIPQRWFMTMRQISIVVMALISITIIM